MSVVLLTDPIDPGQARRLAETARVRLLGGTGIGTLSEEMAAAEIVIVRRAIPAADVWAAVRLRALVRHGVGLDFIPLDAASAAGVAVTNTPGCNDQSVAEHVFGMVLALRRDIAANDSQIRAGAWDALRTSALSRRELRGATLGLIGFGSIGQSVAQIGHFGFGMDVIATRRAPSTGPDWVRFTPLPQVLAQADVLVLACPLTPETTGLISRQALTAMRKDSILVNIARGAVIDEGALAEALGAGTIGGACLDVYSRQPLLAESPLRAAPNTLFSPHVAGVTVDSMARMSRAAVDDSLRILAGERPRHLVNADHWAGISARWAALANET